MFKASFFQENQNTGRISFQGCCNKVPPAGWLKTTKTCAFAAQEAKIQKSSCWVPSEELEGEFVQGLPPSFCYVQIFLSFPL